MYNVAAQAVEAGNYGDALKQLDAIDTRQPDVAAAKNLRGVALMRMGEYRQAEKALQRAHELEPNFWEARFNLAEVPFLEKNWAEARDRFQALAKEPNEEVGGATRDLIQLKVLLTCLLQNRKTEAAEILNRLESSLESPARYYGRVAFALLQKDDAGVKVDLRAAESAFPARVNRLFAESFYEIGWMERPKGAAPVALEVRSKQERVAKARNDFAAAEQAYHDGEASRALELLDRVEETTPNQAVAYNLRGEILLAEGKLEQARDAFQNALAADPQLEEARYNLARLPFKERDYEASRKEFEALLGAGSSGKQAHQREQLIRYQVYLTLLLEGHESAAQKALDEFKMMDDTPALYYAQAAWSFQHGNGKQAGNWIANAKNLFSPELNRTFAAPLLDVGWLGTENASSTARLFAKEPHTSVGPATTPASTPVPVATEPPPSSRTESSTGDNAENKSEVAESSRSAKKKRTARSRSRRKSAGEPRRSKPAASQSETDAATVSTTASIPAAPAPEMASTPVRENLGDKVRNLVFYPFQHRKENAQNAAPAPKNSAARASAVTASPAPSPQRN
jgi:tetratricopeptide (TPR) repeat protein